MVGSCNVGFTLTGLSFEGSIEVLPCYVLVRGIRLMRPSSSSWLCTFWMMLDLRWKHLSDKLWHRKPKTDSIIFQHKMQPKSYFPNLCTLTICFQLWFASNLIFFLRSWSCHFLQIGFHVSNRAPRRPQPHPEKTSPWNRGKQVDSAGPSCSRTNRPWRLSWKSSPPQWKHVEALINGKMEVSELLNWYILVKMFCKVEIEVDCK